MKTSFVRYIVVSIAVLVMMVLFSACSGLGNAQTTVTGSIVSASNGTVVVNVNGQQETINNVPASIIQSLQNQVGKTYTIQVTGNNGSFSIVGGSTPVLDNEGTPNTNETPNTNNETPTANEPGSIQFYGSVQSAGNNSLVVTMPAGGTLSFTTNASTDLKDWNNALPSVGSQVKVEVTANTDGSFTATKVGNVDSSNNTTQAQYTGVTTAAVGSDHVLHFAVGNKGFSFPIASNADLGDFNGNVQSIQNGANIKVTVQFNGSTGSVIQVGANNGN
ncbi:MAG TPA: DUF5666 domain-containing protein [Ktedonobacteraceae bacterium]|nr:DUF5666 domain-containing protein [Ktedonobacteraceae bacterium]